MRVRVQPRPGGVPPDLGQPRLPSSKSHAQRAILLAAFSTETWRITNPGTSDDVQQLIRMLLAIGVALRWEGDTLVVAGAGSPREKTLRVDAGENGTAARALLMVVSLLGGRIEVDGRPSLRRRPMHAATAALRRLGISCDRDFLPIIADGRPAATALTRHARVDAGTTTQAASGAMLAMGLMGGGVVEVLQPAAGGYLELTAQILRDFGAGVEAERQPDATIVYRIGTVRGAGTFHVPGDPSARAFPLGLAALHGLATPDSLRVQRGDAHPDWRIDEDLAALHAAGDRDLALDAGGRPDTVPVLAVAAAQRAAATRLLGVQALRTKESDRLAALACGLVAAGGSCVAGGDELRIRGPLAPCRDLQVLPTVPDHRIVMALSLLGTVMAHGVELRYADAVAKSWPDYFAWLARCATVTLLPDEAG